MRDREEFPKIPATRKLVLAAFCGLGAFIGTPLYHIIRSGMREIGAHGAGLGARFYLAEVIHDGTRGTDWGKAAFIGVSVFFVCLLLLTAIETLRPKAPSLS
jgi:hypothetical protein